MLQLKDKDWPNRYKNKSLKETYLKSRDTYRLKVRDWKKISHTNGEQNKMGVAILISDKIDFEIKMMIKDKEGYYIMIKDKSKNKMFTIINIYAHNRGRQ